MSGMPQLARIKVLIAHSDPLISAGLTVTLQERCDFEVVVCSPAPATATHLPSADVVIADYDSGLRLLMSKGAGSHRVIILTHSDSEAKISHALRQGACGYVLLGCSLLELIDGLRSVHLGGMTLGPRVASRLGAWMKQPALTRREGDVLRQMMLGLSNKAIAANLTVRVGTVKTYVKAIFNKLDAVSRTEAVAIARRRGVLREECEYLPPEVKAVRIAKRSDVRQLRAGSKWSRLRRGDADADVEAAAPGTSLGRRFARNLADTPSASRGPLVEPTRPPLLTGVKRTISASRIVPRGSDD